MGGGNSSSFFNIKQLLPTELLVLNNTFLYNGLNITLSADDSYTTAEINGSVNGACNEYNYIWDTRNIAFPHYYQVDFGTKVYIKKVCFNPINDNVNCLIKDYNIQYSSDGIDFKNIYSTNKIYTSNKGIIGYITADPINQYYEDCINEFDDHIRTRYIKIIIYNSYDNRGYNWTGFCNLRIYGFLGNKIFLDKNNYIYGVG